MNYSGPSWLIQTPCQDGTYAKSPVKALVPCGPVVLIRLRRLGQKARRFIAQVYCFRGLATEGPITFPSHSGHYSTCGGGAHRTTQWVSGIPMGSKNDLPGSKALSSIPAVLNSDYYTSVKGRLYY